MSPLSPIDRQFLDAIPSCVFVVDRDVAIRDFNAASALLLGAGGGATLFERGGGSLPCVHNRPEQGGCGRSDRCQSCLVRDAVTTAYDSSAPVRRETRLDLRRGAEVNPMHCLLTASPLHLGGQKLVLLVIEDITEVVVLRRLLPICMYCKKVRDDRQNWWDVETYLRKNTEIVLSHGICPSCFETKKAELLDLVATRA